MSQIKDKLTPIDFLSLQLVQLNFEIDNYMDEQQKSKNKTSSRVNNCNDCEYLKSLYQEIKLLKAEFDNAYAEAIKSGNLYNAKKIKAELEQKRDFLKNELERMKKNRLLSNINQALSKCNHLKKDYVVKNIFNFVWKLSKEIHVIQVVLFGSQASGRANEWSDIDIAVITDKFKNMPSLERKAFLLKIVNQSSTFSVQPIGFDPDEWFSQRLYDFPLEIKNTGIIILENMSNEKGNYGRKN